MKLNSSNLLFEILMLICLLRVVSLDPIGEGHCIWYDVCGKNPDKPNAGLGSTKVNCLYDGPAKELGAIGIKNLEETCPYLMAELNEIADNGDGKIYTCCAEENVSELKSQLRNLDTLVARCPSCINNLKLDFCYFTCHPNQSSFLLPTEVKVVDGNDAITEVLYYMHEEYGNDTYDSCKYVYYPPLNDVAMGLLCGPYGADFCTADRLFDYLGANDFTPFNIYYSYGSEKKSFLNYEQKLIELDPFNVDTTECNSTDPEVSCSCTDCRDSCPIPTAEIEDEPKMVGDLRLYVFILIMIFALSSALIILGCLCLRSTDEKEEENDSSSCIYTFSQKSSAYVECKVQTGFERYGNAVSHHPFIAIFCGFLLVAILSGGLYKAETTNDPVDLWAGPNSRSRSEKEYFDDKFDPFYRTTQVICTVPNGRTFIEEISLGNANLGNITFGPVFAEEVMIEGMKLQLAIMALSATHNSEVVVLNDICIMPLSPQTDDCLIQSMFNYWQNDLVELQEAIDDGSYLTHLVKCINNPTYMSPASNETCLGTYGGPVFPYVALGGFLEEGQSTSDKNDYEQSTAFIITFLNQNYVDKEMIKPAEAWEKSFLDFMETYKSENLSCAYYSERSIEDQIREIGESDVITVIISYVIMFTYVTLSLGGSRSVGRDCMVNLKISLGLGGVLLVLLSVFSSLGFYGYLEIQSTVFVLEVVPFITLAVGVDNIFLLVQTWQRTDRRPDETVEEHVGRILGLVGPSMLLATLAETTCFFLGALSDMPAVHTFALNAGMALLIDFLLQISCFVAFLTLDAKRVEANRYDVVCCKKSKTDVDKKNTIFLGGFFKDYYGPFLMNNVTRALVLITFIGAALASGSFIPKLGIGLDQDVAMPKESYVLKYFEYVSDYLSVGSPVYFVMTEGYNFTDYDKQNLICSTKNCQENSILSQIFFASLSPDVTEIATGASSWLEAYFDWSTDSVVAGGLGNENEACCRLDKDGDFINSSLASDPNADRTCLSNKDVYKSRPNDEVFMEFLPYFLIDNPHDLLCSSAGHAAYGPAVRILGQFPESEVGANYFMAYHTVLSTSADFTGAIREAYKLTDEINEYLSKEAPDATVTVFPYSIFYVYYEQYLDFWSTAGKTLGISLGSLLLVMFFATGFDIMTAFINLIIIFMIVVDVMGCMHGWGIEFNAVSLVNLVMVSGISVEFCSHFTHAFNQTITGNRKQRTTETLATVGASILSGIAITKLGGIIVLAFANSAVFVIYYFRMYLLMVIFAVSHGLIFLPVLTSLIGAPVNPYIRDLTERDIINRKGGEKYHTEENGRKNFSFKSDEL